MKKVLILSILMISSFLFAQNIEPKYEIVGQMVKATHYYDNGQIREQGYYLEGKLHGKWVSYDTAGVKQSIGEYNKGEKVGKWFFWNNNSLSEVDFNNSKIADVKKWSRDALAKN